MLTRLAQLTIVAVAGICGALAASHWARPELSECRDVRGSIDVAAACAAPLTDPEVVAASSLAAVGIAGAGTEIALRRRRRS